MTERRNPTEAAVRRGAQAARDGQSESDCPYRDKRVHSSHRLSWSRSWINAWLRGFREEKQKMQRDPPADRASGPGNEFHNGC
ncbi:MULTISPECIES: Rmf/CrpP family protein [Caballeronia]|uniref:Rmf/CrpP family protein n=1 Tax=Caballeronia TaxID=1827195 RepID=UPI00286A8502|nr:Rmf/CrpP family protein [Caballeronia sp. LZ001]